jgi:hypothetical protein
MPCIKCLDLSRVQQTHTGQRKILENKKKILDVHNIIEESASCKYFNFSLFYVYGIEDDPAGKVEPYRLKYL